MSVASFLAKYAKPSAAPMVIAPGARVSLDGVRGVVSFVEGGRVVWAEEGGAIHMTLPHYLEVA